MVDCRRFLVASPRLLLGLYTSLLVVFFDFENRLFALEAVLCPVEKTTAVSDWNGTIEIKSDH